MVLFSRSARRGMVAGAAISSSRARKQAAAQAQPVHAPAPAPQAAPVASADQAIEQIKKLAELKDQGILTDAEFDAKKKQLLGL